MSNTHQDSADNSTAHSSGIHWRPVSPPRQRHRSHSSSNSFHAYMLLPGLSNAFHAETLSRSRTAIITYRANARAAAQRDPEIFAQAQQALRSMTPHDGMGMARIRGAAQLPYWSRLAILEFRRQGMTQVELAAAFRCSRKTVVNVLGGGGKGYSPLSGTRILTAGQQLPPGRFRATA